MMLPRMKDEQNMKKWHFSSFFSLYPPIPFCAFSFGLSLLLHGTETTFYSRRNFLYNYCKAQKTLKQSSHTSSGVAGLVHILEHSVQREKGGGLKFDLVCTDTGREGGVWSIHLARRRKKEEGGVCSTVGHFFYEWGVKGGGHFLLRTQGRKFMNGSHLPSCSKCKQHSWTKKKHERSALAKQQPDFFTGPLIELGTQTQEKNRNKQATSRPSWFSVRAINLTDDSVCLFPAGFQGDKGQSRSLDGRMPSSRCWISVVLCSSGVLFKENHIFLLGLYHRSLTQQTFCVKVACLHNLSLNGRQSTLVSHEPRDKAANEIHLPDVQGGVAQPLFCPLPNPAFQHIPLCCFSRFLFLFIFSDSSSTVCLSTPHPKAGNWLSQQQCLILPGRLSQCKPQLYSVTWD